jgi:hypothetical protein
MVKHTSRRRHTGISREELHALTAALDRCRRDLDIQFKRTAQVQAELEALQRAFKKFGDSSRG